MGKLGKKERMDKSAGFLFIIVLSVLIVSQFLDKVTLSPGVDNGSIFITSLLSFVVGSFIVVIVFFLILYYYLAHN